MLEFATFFQALWRHAPFPWQSMLAERIAAAGWPQALDLPTASGKTACIDIALHALVAQAERPLAERTAPRRIWLVVDRRIVVDEAFERAQEIAEALAEAKAGPLNEAADRLRLLSGTPRPLAVARLRGGILRDDGWARIPSQPAIITSTVDQLGSRLLFRGYGRSLLTAPIFAGLAANDSLIILDEAHCAVPLLQTLRAIERYRGPQWAESPLRIPFAFVVMSATPPPDIPSAALFPGRERARALDHPALHRRIRTSKPAELVGLDRLGGAAGDPLVAEAAGRVVGYLDGGKRRVAVMVNRVRTAEAVAATLCEKLGDGGDVVLLTGRIRPFERDWLVERWTPFLRAREPVEPEKPVVVVATQCLEVGADFSFDALVTECGSLDALRQRFGRLARLGTDEAALAAILIRQDDMEPEKPDPVYGPALPETWKWLGTQATPGDDGRLIVDFGIEALDAKVRELDDPSPLLAPTEHAPVLLPAHLDLLCQTAPPASPEPEISLYLHGRPGPPEVSVVWRCDLSPGDTGAWVETVALSPPVSGEMLQAPLWRIRAWLAERLVADDSGDVEGAGAEEGAERRLAEARIRPCILWRGRDRSRVALRASELVPGDVVVVPASYGVEGLGQVTGVRALGAEGIDLWEAARARAEQPPATRVNRSVLAPWLDCPPLRDLAEAAASPAWERRQIRKAVDAVLAYAPASGGPPAPPAWWLDLLRGASDGRIEDHPGGGLILFARGPAPARAPIETDLFADDDDLLSAADRAVTLGSHARSVERAATTLAARCLPEDLRGPVRLASYWHDVGKLDERFQVMLYDGDEIKAASATTPLAKAAAIPPSPTRRREIREASGLPHDFRHEMLSTQLAGRCATLLDDQKLTDLVLHLVASHHGHARPFAPVSVDPSPPAVHGDLNGARIAFHADERVAWPPAHRVDSGLAERFWRLVRRYGWWGLAYLEAIVRLADWYASALVTSTDGETDR